MTGTTRHPYSDLQPKSLWRRAVAEVHPLALDGLYTKKFPISVEDRVVTAGSCFAQHIARKMSASGFNYKNYEPAPAHLPNSEHASFNYGVYSARYCNIYTVRQLLQLFDRAFGKFRPVEEMWSGEEGVHDAFRPALEPTPFGTEAEFRAAQESHLAAVRNVFKGSDLFVFTLGLTEAWVSKQDGSVFPLCPGTAGGSFDPSRYAFKNFTFSEIYSDLKKVINKVRKVNPQVRFLLTVSPVPLTATATDQHILVATMNSKSVLRAVAGQVASEDGLVDYFPSYEIISAPSMRGMFFEPNMLGCYARRRIRHGALLQGTCAACDQSCSQAQAKEASIADGGRSRLRGNVVGRRLMLVVIGDSHTLALRKGFESFSEAEQETARERTGGIGIQIVQAGYRFLVPFHRRCADGAVTFSRQFCTRRLQLASGEAGSATDRMIGGDGRRYIFCVGGHGIVFARHPMWEQFSIAPDQRRHFISKAAFQVSVEHFSATILTFFDDLNEAGVAFEVLFCPPLPENQWRPLGKNFETPGDLAALNSAFRDAYARALTKRGIAWILPPAETVADGMLKPQYVSTARPDDYHAEATYGALMMRKLLA